MWSQSGHRVGNDLKFQQGLKLRLNICYCRILWKCLGGSPADASHPGIVWLFNDLRRFICVAEASALTAFLVCFVRVDKPLFLENFEVISYAKVVRREFCENIFNYFRYSIEDYRPVTLRMIRGKDESATLDKWHGETLKQEIRQSFYVPLTQGNPSFM